MLVKVEMVDPQRMALLEIADPRLTRDDVAITYAYCLRQNETDRIAEVNHAIIERWSMSTLHYIKQKAWKRVGH
jgi:hypothetical protein